MTYTNDEALAEVLRRGKALARRRNKRRTRLLSGVSGLMFCLLTMALFTGVSRDPGHWSDSAYGAFLLSAEAGGYVLAAVAAFLLGVAVTLLLIRKKNADSMRRIVPESDEREGGRM